MPNESASFRFEGGDPRRNILSIEDAILAGVLDGVQEASEFTKSLAQQTLTQLEKVDRGTLRASIATEYSGGSSLAGRFSVGASLNSRVQTITGKVFTGLLYGQWVEFGRRGLLSSYPGITRFSAKAAWPPIGVIREWVIRNAKKLDVATGDQSDASDEVETATYLISRKIAEKGIEPTPFLRPAYDYTKPKLKELIRSNVALRLGLFRGTNRRG